MIETRVYYTIPATVFQRVTGEIDLEEINRGTAEANEIIQSVIKKYGSFNLIVDARGIRFADLAAHRTSNMETNRGKLSGHHGKNELFRFRSG